MLSSRRLLAWLLPALVLLLIGLGINLAIHYNSSRTLRFQDGRQFTLTSVTYGTNHVYRSGAPLARLVAPLLSAKLKVRFGVSEVVEQTPVASIVVWGRWTGFNLKTNHPVTPAVLVDGTAGQTDWSKPFFVPTTSQSERVSGWKFLNYPRRGKIFKFRLFQQQMDSKPEISEEFEIVNPSPGKYPQWSPRPCPQTITNEGWECTLLHFGPTDLRIQRSSLWGGGEQGHAALFKITQDRTNALGWQPEFIEISDATGNSLVPNHIMADSIAEFKQLRFSGPLWASEPAWKVRCGFVRTAGFRAEELVSFSDIPAHDASHLVQIGTNVSVQGAYISEISLKPYYFLLPIRSRIRPNAQLVLKAAGPALGWHFTLVGLKDQDQRLLPFERGKYIGMEWQFPFKMPSGTKSLSFQFAAQRIRTVEFVAGMQTRDTRSELAPSGRSRAISPSRP